MCCRGNIDWSALIPRNLHWPEKLLVVPLYLQMIFECIGFHLGNLPKLNRGLELVSAEHFLHIYFCKNLQSNKLLNQLTKFYCLIFFTVHDIKQFVFFNSCLIILGHYELYNWFSVSRSYKFSNGWRRKKKGKIEVQKLQYFKGEKCFFL